MRIGLMRTPLEFQTYIETKDALNQPQKSWSFYCKGFGKILHQNQSQRWATAQTLAEGEMIIEIHYNPGLLEKLVADVEKVRAKSGDRIFEIKNYFDPDERKKRLHLVVKEVM